MPIQHIKYLNPYIVVGIWHLTEPESFFQTNLNKLVTDPENLKSIHHANRRREWLAGRYLVAEMTKIVQLPFNGIWTDEYNKPHLKLDNASISISHASPYVVAILNTRSLCGIDIEMLRDKLLPLSPKFLNENELKIANSSLEKLAICWGAKEALYKLHGRKSLIFKENLVLSDFDFTHPVVTFTGLIKLEEGLEKYNLKAGRFNDYVLVFTT
jgi:4'-phosphopantetheinyl transferase